LERCWNDTPEFEAQPVRQPIFITGMPRSGSTFLHELLAQDNAIRAPRIWEVMFPLPGSAALRTARAALCLWWFRRMAPGADAVHPIRATMPHECVAIHSYTLLSREFITTFRIPAYENFLSGADFEPAYAWQKRFLQHLQWDRPPRRWVLKAPDHVFHLNSLVRVFPDAAIIQTHRNPLEVLESSSRLSDVVQRVFARRQPAREIGAREACVLADGVNRVTHFRTAHPELAGRFIDVNYHDLISRPVETISRVYRRLNLPMTRATARRIREVAARRSRYARPPRAPASLAALGIDRDAETRRFAGYCARFGVRRL
jgi:hypothetical protein